MADIEKVVDGGELLGMVIRGEDYEEGVSFPTSQDMPFQLGLHNQPKGKVIPAHLHKKIENISLNISEIFYIKKGKVRIILYNHSKDKVGEILAGMGDIVYLIGGHGFEFLEDTIMFEVKQGPYRTKEEDKEMI